MKKENIISLIAIILIIASLFFCLIIIPTILTLLAGKYLGFWGALLFTGLIGLINNVCIGIVCWAIILALIMKTLMKLGIVKKRKKQA